MSLLVPGGLSAINAAQLLHVLRGADMTSTTDQPFARVFAGSTYLVTSCVARTRSGATSALTSGGIYTGAGKTGDVLVPATQGWGSLTLTKIVNAVLSSIVPTNLETATPILSLSLGSTSACLCDIYLFGVDLT